MKEEIELGDLSTHWTKLVFVEVWQDCAGCMYTCVRADDSVGDHLQMWHYSDCMPNIYIFKSTKNICREKRIYLGIQILTLFYGASLKQNLVCEIQMKHLKFKH